MNAFNKKQPSYDMDIRRWGLRAWELDYRNASSQIQSIQQLSERIRASAETRVKKDYQKYNKKRKEFRKFAKKQLLNS